MQRDGRSFDHGTLVAIRLMAVERVREGERASSVISSYGFNRTKPVHLVVDGLPAHKTKLVKQYVASTEGRLTILFLPGTRRN